MPENFTPAKVAKHLATSATTVRRLTAAYADHLSDGATPPPGGRRQYNDEDVQTLAYVLELQNAGQSEEEIQAALATGTLPAPFPTNLPIETSQPPANLAILPDATIRTLDSIATSLEVIAGQQQAIDALQRRLQEQSKDSRRMLWVLAAGVLVAVVMGAIATVAIVLLLR